MYILPFRCNSGHDCLKIKGLGFDTARSRYLYLDKYLLLFWEYFLVFLRSVARTVGTEYNLIAIVTHCRERIRELYGLVSII